MPGTLRYSTCLAHFPRELSSDGCLHHPLDAARIAATCRQVRWSHREQDVYIYWHRYRLRWFQRAVPSSYASVCTVDQSKREHVPSSAERSHAHMSPRAIVQPTYAHLNRRNRPRGPFLLKRSQGKKALLPSKQTAKNLFSLAWRTKRSPWKWEITAETTQFRSSLKD
jgi:hypothetical protein